MKKLALAFLPLALIAFSPSTALAEANRCPHPVPERRYEAERLVTNLALDLSGCSWWDGSPIKLVASLDRFDGQSGHGTATAVLCGGGGDEEEAMSRRQPAQPTCEISVEIEHPQVEVARYHGEVSYPWRGAERVVSFDATCTSLGEAVGCRTDGDRTT
jgi:hypothetical protein